MGDGKRSLFYDFQYYTLIHTHYILSSHRSAFIPHLRVAVYIQHNQTVLDKQEAFIFKWKQNCFIHYNPDYAQSSILGAQFKSKVI